ncbi:HEAT repeat domain-containing protein, partial [Myxococcota bacterium]|nr:HEAT repeat domain-containing protein [Myxococcota bacterium]
GARVEPDRYESSAAVRRRGAPGEPFDALVADAIRDAGDDVATAMRLADAKDDAVIEALDSPERGVRARAIAMCGERKLRAAVPKLVELVKRDDQDQDLVLKAIGALVAIRDPRAVGALIDAGRRRSAGYLTQILFAVADLGGREAEAYLFTVSTGHPDPEIRRVAKQALEELERKRGAAPLVDGSSAE